MGFGEVGGRSVVAAIIIIIIILVMIMRGLRFGVGRGYCKVLGKCVYCEV